MAPTVSDAGVTEYGTDVSPLPSAVPPVAGRRVPNESLQVPGLVVEKRNQPVALAPLGVAVAFIVAEVWVMALAAWVTTAGTSGLVVNEAMAPKVVPAEFCAMAQ